MALIQLAAFSAQHQNVVDSDGTRDLKHLLEKPKHEIPPKPPGQYQDIALPNSRITAQH